MIWTMEQVAQARSLRATMRVAAEVVDRPGSEDLVRGEIAKRLVDMAHPLGLELDASDMELLRTDDHEAVVRNEIEVHGRWNPSVTGAVLVGGPRDGERWALQRVGDPLRVEVLNQTPWRDESETAADAALSITYVEYVLTGWHEAERLWAYEPRQNG